MSSTGRAFAPDQHLASGRGTRSSATAQPAGPPWAEETSLDDGGVEYRRTARTEVASVEGPVEVSIVRWDERVTDPGAAAFRRGRVMVVVDGIVFDLDQAHALRAALAEVVDCS